MRTEDIADIAEEMNKAGFYSMEVWGGATFDVATRFLNVGSGQRGQVSNEPSSIKIILLANRYWPFVISLLLLWYYPYIIA